MIAISVAFTSGELLVDLKGTEVRKERQYADVNIYINMSTVTVKQQARYVRLDSVLERQYADVNIYINMSTVTVKQQARYVRLDSVLTSAHLGYPAVESKLDLMGSQQLSSTKAEVSGDGRAMWYRGEINSESPRGSGTWP